MNTQLPIDRKKFLSLISLIVLIVLTIFAFSLLNKNEVDSNPVVPDVSSNAERFYEGKITYVDPRMYPQDNISYILADASGNEVILLKASDEKLQVSEGHYAKVYGNLSKTKDRKKDILLVNSVRIQNGSN